MPDIGNQEILPNVDENRDSSRSSRGLYFNRRSLMKMMGATLMLGPGVVNAALAEAGSEPPVSISALPIFPHPRQCELTNSDFVFSSSSVILLPENPSAGDLSLAHFVAREFSSRFDVHPELRFTNELPRTGSSILVGSVQNPLIQKYCAREHIELSAEHPGPEGYILRVGEREAVVAGSDDRGAFFGLQSLRQIISRSAGGVRIQGIRVVDWPDKQFRGIYVFLPGPENLVFFERFISDFAALYKFNTLMVEMNACMRLDNHPELNTGWVEFARDINYSRRNYPPGSLHGRGQNSSHQDCGDGTFIEKSDVSSLVRIARNNRIDFVPVIQSLTHSYYLLTKHKELSEVPGDEWPDTYCASNPASHKLLFEVMDEFLDVTKPKMVHAGHDEWFAPFGLCPCCRNRDPGEVYGKDIEKIHDHLATKNMRMAMWGDYLLENVRGKGLQKRTTRSGWTYYTPGAMTPEQVKSLVPKDILIFNWFWSEKEKGRQNETMLKDFGFDQIYGNMEPNLRDYVSRSSLSGLVGGAPSSWAASTEFNISKDLLSSLLGCSSLLWSKEPIEGTKLASTTQARCPEIRNRLSGSPLPSETGDPTVPIDISESFNVSAQAGGFGQVLACMRSGVLDSGSKKFQLSTAHGKLALAVGVEGEQPLSWPREPPAINVGRDATSLIFLHACARPAHNRFAYRLIWDEKDSADLLGWYEIVYEDELTQTIPIRYGVNILEWNAGSSASARSYCYLAEEIDCGNLNDSPIRFYAFEWKNPRLGKVIREVRLKGSKHFRGAVHGWRNTFGSVIASNVIALKAMSFVPARQSKS